MVKIGLALSGGGPKGLAHIGVIKLLEENNIPIDYIAGSSIGSLIGGFYATKKNVKEVEEIATKMGRLEILSIFLEPSLNQGIVAGQKLENFINKNIGDLDFKNLKIPFCAVATDFKTNKAFYFNKGSVTRGIRASCAVPFIFKPVFHEDRILVDGALSTPVPVEILFKMGADIVIAVNLYAYADANCQSDSVKIIDTGPHSFSILLHNLSKENVKKSNIVISPDVCDMGWKSLFSQEQRIKTVKVGYTAALEKLPELKKLLELQKENIFEKIKNFFATLLSFPRRRESI